MATRNERVVLSLQDQGFSTGMARAAAQAALLDRALDGLDGSGVRVQRSMGGAAKSADTLGVSARRNESSINQLTGRLRVLADVAAIIGPSLVPIGAVGIPAVTGLAQQLGFAALGMGSLVAASQGVGDALEAVNKAALDPSIENLEKAVEAMAVLGPHAQEFVRHFQDLRPVLNDIRDASAAGWFPGLIDAMDELERIAPQVADLFQQIGDTGGSLLAEGAAAFAGPEWADFRSFLVTEGPPALEELGRTVGNVAAGMAQMWKAFSPLNRDFSSWLLDASRGFREWSEDLSRTEGFAEFVDYIRTNGPRVADAMKAIGTAVLEIVEAVAPLGGPSLAIIESFATAVAAIADSDLGTPIFAAVAAYAALNRVLQVTAALQARITGTATVGGGVAGMLGLGPSARAGIKGTVTDLRSMSREYDRLGRAQSTFISGMSQTSGAAQRTAQRLQGIGKAGAGVAALTVATTGLGDSMGITNTASLGMMGTIAGPWGAAIGSGIGFAMDFAAANNDIEAAVKAANLAMDSQDLGAMAQAYSILNDQLSQANDLRSRDGFWDFVEDTTSMEGILAQAEMLGETFFGIDSSATVAEDALAKLARTQANVAAQGRADAAAALVRANDRLGLTTSTSQLAMSEEELALAAAQANERLMAQRQAVHEAAAQFLAYNDAVAGAKFNLGDYLGGLEKQVEAQARFDANISNLRSRGLDDSVIQELIRQGPEAAQAVDALANGSEAAINRMNRVFAQGARGVNTFGEDTRRELQAAKEGFDALPKSVRTEIRAEGIPQTKGEVDQLVDKYKLTEKQRQALVTLKDLASDRIQAVIRQLLDYDRRDATANVNVDAGGAISQIASIKAYLASIPRSITTRVAVSRYTVNGGRSTTGGVTPDADGGFHVNGVKRFATGGWGEDGRYYQRVPQMIRGGANILWGEQETGWEAYISGKPGMEDRNREILGLAAERLGMAVVAYADGGGAGADWKSEYARPPAPGASGSPRYGRMDLPELRKALRGLNRELGKSEKSVANERKQRDAVADRMRSLRSDVSSGLRTELGGEVDPWSSRYAGGSYGADRATLKGDIAEGREFIRLVKQLKAKGMSGAALAEIIGSGDIERARLYASLPRADVREANQLINTRDRVLAQAGSYAGSAAFGAQFRRSDREWREERKEHRELVGAVRKLEKTVEQQEKKNRESQRKGAQQAGQNRRRDGGSKK